MEKELTEWHSTTCFGGIPLDALSAKKDSFDNFTNVVCTATDGSDD